MHTLAAQFRSALQAIEVKDERRDHAVAAHTEIRGYLEADSTLRDWGVATVLIGSYARHTGIWPGKDVDVFAKLTRLSVGASNPRKIFEHVRDLLVDAYGSNATPQNRSVKIDFSRDEFEFSVDVVPAVKWGDQWAIPRRDTATWDEPDETRWVRTDPEQLAALTEKLNRKVKVGDQGAYVPMVKLMRQARNHHLGKAKPGGFYFELMTYWAFDGSDAAGGSFAEVFATALESVAKQLQGGAPLEDPVLGRDCRPQPDSGDRAAAAQTFSDLAAKAREAVATDDICIAGALWREILGQNEKGWCFPVPEGCDEHGRKLEVAAPAVSRGSRQAGGFA